ncbi:hypothetical protein DFH11DRAFT_844400 [Phellopilus nigrolimitatus]|nr:hypothetical protein DFH11DRAFT_844400 [Phellopilus nigrolimitatus]
MPILFSAELCLNSLAFSKESVISKATYPPRCATATCTCATSQHSSSGRRSNTCNSPSPSTSPRVSSARSGRAPSSATPCHPCIRARRRCQRCRAPRGKRQGPAEHPADDDAAAHTTSGQSWNDNSSTLHFPTLFANDFGPAVFLFPQPPVVNRSRMAKTRPRAPSRTRASRSCAPLDEILKEQRQPGWVELRRQQHQLLRRRRRI